MFGLECLTLHSLLRKGNATAAAWQIEKRYFCYISIGDGFAG